MTEWWEQPEFQPPVPVIPWQAPPERDYQVNFVTGVSVRVRAASKDAAFTLAQHTVPTTSSGVVVPVEPAPYIVVFAQGTVPHVTMFYADSDESAGDIAQRRHVPAGYSLQYVARVVAN